MFIRTHCTVCVAPTFDRPETVIVVDVDDLFPSAGGAPPVYVGQ